MMTYDEFGVLLRKLREERSLSQKDVAEETGISDRTISDYERGLYLPGTHNCAILSEFFKKDLFAYLANAKESTQTNQINAISQFQEVVMEDRDEKSAEKTFEDNNMKHAGKKFNPEGIMLMIILCALTFVVFIADIFVENKLFVCGVSGILILICAIYSYLLKKQEIINRQA